MSYEHWLKLAFIAGAVLWVAANAFFTPRYIRTLWAVRDPRRAPFVASAVWLGLFNLLNVGYWLWLIFWTPRNPDIIRVVVFVIPFDYISGAIAYMIFNGFVMQAIDNSWPGDNDKR